MRSGWVLMAVLMAAPAWSGAPRGKGQLKPHYALKDLKLLYFHAAWCQPCAAFDKTKTLERVRHELPGLTIETIDVEAHPEQQARYRIEVLPTLLVVTLDGVKLFQPRVALDDPDATVNLILEGVRRSTGA